MIKRAVAILCIPTMALSCLAFTGRGSDKGGSVPADSKYIGTWQAVSAELKGESDELD